MDLILGTALRTHRNDRRGDRGTRPCQGHVWYPKNLGYIVYLRQVSHRLETKAGTLKSKCDAMEQRYQILYTPSQEA